MTLPRLAIVLLLAAGCDARVPSPFDARVVPRDGGPPSRCAAPGSVADGSPCRCGADCREGTLCVTETSSGVPGGICWRPCTIGAPDDCAAGATCLDREGVGGGRGFCELTCVRTADCPPGRFCGDGTCVPGCAADADCETGHCDPWRSRCAIAPPATEAGETLATCTRGADCRSGFCHPAYVACLSICDLDRPFCPPGEACVLDSASSTDDVGACLPRCVLDADCGPENLCELGAARGRTERVCFPRSARVE